MGKRKLAQALRDYQTSSIKLSKSTMSAKGSLKLGNKDTSSKQEASASAVTLAPFFEYSNAQLFPFPYSPCSKILLIGEGNLSYASCIIDYYSGLLQSSDVTLPDRLNGLNGNVKFLLVATVYEDSESVLVSKYPESQRFIANIVAKGGIILYGVNACTLDTDKRLLALHARHKFSRIVFQFPHLGAGIKDQEKNKEKHVLFMARFFVSAAKLLAKVPKKAAASQSLFRYKIKMLAVDNAQKLQPKYYSPLLKRTVDNDEESSNESFEEEFEEPEIHVTLKDCEPYVSWNIRKLPKQHCPDASLRHRESFVFLKERCVNYVHVNTIGHLDSTAARLTDAKMDLAVLPDHLEGRSSKTYIFVLN